MKISATTNYDIKFQVTTYWDEEGGMGSDSFGPIVDNLQEALIQLELAQSRDAKEKIKTRWIIEAIVNKKIS